MKRYAFVTLAVAATLGAALPTLSHAQAAEKAAPAWRNLLEPSMGAWRGYKEQAVPKEWTVKDGVLSKSVGTNDLITRDEFQNFELSWDWKLQPGGNAGVFYRGNEEAEKIYFTGPEYQLLDDARHPDGKSRLTAAGSDYALYPVAKGIVHAADHWNSSRIVARGKHVEHWLNGQKVVTYEFGSADWEKRLKASKFGTAAHYGRLERGHIGIQGDHDGTLWIRNMKIRVLP
jgi:hypothetical protein